MTTDELLNLHFRLYEEVSMKENILDSYIRWILLSLICHRVSPRTYQIKRKRVRKSTSIRESRALSVYRYQRIRKEMANFAEEYLIVLIDNEDDAYRCAEFLAEEFVENNPLTICTGTSTKRLFDVWLWPLMIESLDEKLSFFVRNHQNNEIIAAIIANDLYHYCQRHPYDSSSRPTNEPVTDFLDEMRFRFVESEFGQSLVENLALNIAAGATKASYASRGIAMKLRMHLCQYARDRRGFSYGFVQTAHPATRHIYLNKMNGKMVESCHPRIWFLERIHLYDQSSPLKNYQSEPIDSVLIPLKNID